MTAFRRWSDLAPVCRWCRAKSSDVSSSIIATALKPQSLPSTLPPARSKGSPAIPAPRRISLAFSTTAEPRRRPHKMGHRLRLSQYPSLRVVRSARRTLLGISGDLGVKGKSGVLASKAPVRRFLRKPRASYNLHFTPKHSSWLNQIEIWFSILVRKLLRRGNFASKAEPCQNRAVHRLLHRDHGKALKWTRFLGPGA